MKQYFDLDKKQLVKPPGEGGVVRSVSFIRGDHEPLEVVFLKAGEEVTDVTNIVAVIKEAPGEDEPSLADCQEWEEEEGVFIGLLPLNGTALNTLIAAKTSIILLYEITCYHAGYGPITAEAVKCTLKNDLWRGTEGTPLELPTPEAWLYARAAALTYAGTDPNTLPTTLYISGITVPSGSDPYFMTRGADFNNRARWFYSTGSFYYNGNAWVLSMPAGQQFTETNPLHGRTPVGIAVFTPSIGAAGNISVGGDVENLDGQYLGQPCYAETAVWRWNGTAWIPEHLLTGEPIMGAPGAYFSLGRDGDGAAAFTPFPNI